MLSLYVHIPFCRQKCAYCAFTSFPQQPGSEEFSVLVKSYLAKLDEELAYYANIYGEQMIKTIALGGGTPSLLGIEGIKQIVDMIGKYFPLVSLAELSIEANPFPMHEMIEIVRGVNRLYRNISRIRRSFGIQTFDNDILQKTGRPSSFAGIVDFLREIRSAKQENSLINLDFIAFGKPYDAPRKEFFERLVKSGMAESYSLYTLELQEGSERKELPGQKPGTVPAGAPRGDAEAIEKDFFRMKNIVEKAGYGRYEISNFCKPGQGSVHNAVYRQMENYLGIGISASSFVDKQRRTNTKSLPEYLNTPYTQPETKKLTDEDYQIESFFLGLRMRNGITDWKKYIPLFVADYEQKLQQFQEQKVLTFDDEVLALTDKGMDLAHTIITDLLQKI